MSEADRVPPPAAVPSSDEWVDGRRAGPGRRGGLSDRVRDHLRQHIITGTIKPGTMIQIAPVAEQLGVSRTPVREALLSLQQSKLVTVVPNQGFMVRALSIDDIRDIYVMRSVIETATAERAAARATDENHAELLELLRQSDEVAGVTYTLEFDGLCRQYHEKIANIADSHRLAESVRAIFDDLLRLQSIGVMPPDPHLIVVEHREILDAVVAGNPSSAKRAMDVHIATLHRTAVSGLVVPPNSEAT
ncbi:GntR family transcriptional regulator [Rhodococcus sp. BP-349]|uniref:GntR family transcriptional regulator n=1 Tax=unclassified Rhodococcus (in: high G+C Gram-positive bacteria) TaxID=192944 RepID=UPI001C9A6667|nr:MULTISPECIES: GntR family transcriptional regulator [unclassified Rhodococcus (in: high G+C Gram-positive bacteria)]MBY6538835.1 GntR family transcriptional regulator [Rhodococcus sp. BP-363]MBY6543172.1 GntR family transcriptional regulator [Rhodococcus sp. BP-369]MBY6562402.1 GntR family transcriptional regulator [Rhodococcus sp. BP-370]MBY6576694.1 GntR family transcriptional regulator [Rhodococcus sp. BP-364]MBY6585995.1 GntR family transcriptional regulator [Rhodococcus sp. BP-358]